DFLQQRLRVDVIAVRVAERDRERGRVAVVVEDEVDVAAAIHVRRRDRRGIAGNRKRLRRAEGAVAIAVKAHDAAGNGEQKTEPAFSATTAGMPSLLKSATAGTPCCARMRSAGRSASNVPSPRPRYSDANCGPSAIRSGLPSPVMSAR